MAGQPQLDLPESATLRVVTRSDWHVGTGSGVPGGVNAVVRTDVDGLPYLPGTTLTGVYREACLQVAAGLDGPANAGPGKAGLGAAGPWTRWVGHLFGSRQDQQPRPDGPSRALVRIRAGRGSQALRDRLVVARQLLDATVFVKPGVSICHETGRAKDRTVWSVEMARAGLTLHAPVELDESLTGAQRTAASVLLVLGAAWLRTLGGNRRRGAGEVAVQVWYPQAPEWSELVAGCADWASTQQPPPPVDTTTRGSALTIATATASGRLERGDSWMELPLTLTALEALRAPRATVGNVIQGHEHIPGTMLLAWALTRLGAPVTLRRALIGGAAVLTHAVPEIDGSPRRPAPAALEEPKSADGRLRNSFRQPRFEGTTTEPLWTRWVAGAADGTSPLPIVKPAEVLITHNVVTVLSGRPTTDDGGVFTVQVIPAGTRLRGALRLRASVAAGLAAEHGPGWYEALAGESRLGSAAKSEYGRVAVTVGDPTEVPEPSLVLDGDTFTVWALSDVLVRDVRLRLSANVDDVVAALANRLGVALELLDRAVRAGRTESWQGSWQLPRPSMVGLAAGSCLKLAVTSGAIDPTRLADVTAGGLGLRTGEGFGQLAIGAALLNRDDLTWYRDDLTWYRGVSQTSASSSTAPGDLDDPADRAYLTVVERIAFREALVRHLRAPGTGPHGREDPHARDDEHSAALAKARVRLRQPLRALSPSQRGGFRELIAGLRSPGGVDRLRAVLERPHQRRQLTGTVKVLAGLAGEDKLAFLLEPVRARLGIAAVPRDAWVDAFGLFVLDALNSIEAADRTAAATGEAADTRLTGHPPIAAAPPDVDDTGGGRARRDSGKASGSAGPARSSSPASKRQRYRRVHTRWELTATLVARTPLHVGGIHDDEYLDLSVARDGRDEPYVPGSSLAGVLRSWWQDRFGKPSVEAVWDGRARRDGDATDPKKNDDFLASLIEIADAPLHGADGEPPVLGHRDGVGIDRWTGAAAHRVKYERQVVPAGTRLLLRLVADDVEPGEGMGAHLTQLTHALTGYGLTVGAASTRGLGRLAAVPGTVKLGSFPVGSRNGMLAAIRRTVAPEEEPAAVDATTAGKQAFADRPGPGILRFEVIWRPDGPLLVGAALPGERAALLPLLDAHPDTGDPVPVLPGSSVKGVLSAEVERALRTGATPDGHDDDARLGFNAHRAEMACRFPAFERLFGSRDRRGALSIPDTYAQPATRSTWADWADYRNGKRTDPPGDGWGREATHVAVDRWTGGAAPGLLFTVLEPHHLPWAPLRLDLDLRRLSDDLRRRTAEVTLVLYALASLAAGTVPLGRGGNRGLGAVEVQGLRVYAGENAVTLVPQPGSWTAGNLLRHAGDPTARRDAVLALARDLCAANGIEPGAWTEHLRLEGVTA